MKFNFKKIASVLASTVMLSSTVALAAAANYPSPFVQNGVADVAVVYGSNAAQTDLVAATDITTSLNSRLATTTTAPTTVAGGDYVKLERATDRFNLGDEMDDFYSNLDDEELSVVLASGIYQNDDNEEFDYEQSINLAGGLTLEHFADNSLDENEVPVIGFDLTNDDPILNYTLEFIDPAEAGGAWVADNALETTELPMLGRTYYVVSARNTTFDNHKITLLDTANSAFVTEGETATIVVGGTGYDVSIEFIDADNVILNVNGVRTNKLQEGDTFKVSTDLYVSVKSVLYNSKESGVSIVDISLGSGKIVLENGQEVQINNEDISSLTDSVLNSHIEVDGDNLESITLEWILDDDAWIVPGRDLVLPGFETIKLSMGGFTMDSQEETMVEPDGDDSITVTAPIKDGDVTLNLLYLNASNTGIDGLGKRASQKLVTNATATPTVNLNETEDSYFVATWISGDDAESYAFEIKSINDNDGKNETTLENLANGAEVVFSEVGKVKDVGSLQLTLLASSDDAKLATVKVSANSGTVYADRVVTSDGLMFKLPVISAAAGDGNLNLSGNDPTSWNMNFTEETKDGDIQEGNSVIVSVSVDGDDGLEPAISSGVTMLETEDGSDQYEGYVVSELATKFFLDKPTTGLNDLTVEYHDTEAYADVFVSETGAAVVVAEGAGRVLAVTDTESVSAKNLIVVGGSCINSVAADLLGGALCGADFEARTGVGAGSFLIETFARDGGGVATLVAGYNAADTTNAARYLTTQTVDTAVGTAYKGTTSTSAELVVA